ncbi:membrane protein YoeI [Escherichia coli]
MQKNGAIFYATVITVKENDHVA